MKPLEKRFRKGTRTGFTTGACAAAAVRAATLGLLRGAIPERVETILPNGETVYFAVEKGRLAETGAEAVVIKDAGDDPDCTHGAHLTARVRRLADKTAKTILLGGNGVGRVTRPGLGLPVNEAAINPIPRRNILENIRAVTDGVEMGGLEVTLSVPGGADLAKKTLNPRLGIIGGISILGTTGIVHPYSTSAYKAAVEQSVRAAAAMGLETIVFTTGRRTERFAMAQRPDLPEQAFIQMGDFFGAAMASARSAGLSRVIVAAMTGKLAKMGQNLDNTHAHKTPLDMERVADLVRRAGGSETQRQRAATGITVRHAAELLVEPEMIQRFHQLLAEGAAATMRSRLAARTRVMVLAFDYEGKLLSEYAEPGQ